MDIYIVLDGMRVVGVSARQQGAELIRGDRAATLADELHPGDRTNPKWQQAQRIIYGRMLVENHELEDVD